MPQFDGHACDEAGFARYVQHGVPAEVALQFRKEIPSETESGVPVLSVVHGQELVKTVCMLPNLLQNRDRCSALPIPVHLISQIPLSFPGDAIEVFGVFGKRGPTYVEKRQGYVTGRAISAPM